MKFFERLSIAIRHNPVLEHSTSLWDRVRPVYNSALARLNPNGLERIINGTDHLYILPYYRGLSEYYEPEVWSHLMAEVKAGDVVADVGAFIGLYSVALAKRVGPTGRVIAFEPEPNSYQVLQTHVAMNDVAANVEMHPTVVGSTNQSVSFAVGHGSESAVGSGDGGGTVQVRCVRLDDVFNTRKVDILKIDVEGYEEEVLKGAYTLLTDPQRGPRRIYIEVHPFAWSKIGTTSQSLLTFLDAHGYQMLFLDGTTVTEIAMYGEIVAVKRGNR